MSKIVINQYVKKRERAFRLLTKTALEEYDVLLNNKPELIRDTPLGILSSYLGITPQSLSRIRKNGLHKVISTNSLYNLCMLNI